MAAVRAITRAAASGSTITGPTLFAGGAGQTHPMAETDPGIRVVPANEATWDDLALIFGSRGPASRCLCQRFKLGHRESFRSFPAEERAHRLRQQTECGQPDAESTSGLIAYLGDEPVGWCAVEPRPRFVGLVRVFRVPWEGRDEDKTDESVWAVTCFLTRAGYRRRGIGRALARATVDFARSRGAIALEGYPIDPNVMSEELHVGTERMFADAGFAVVTRPGVRRLVMRIDF